MTSNNGQWTRNDLPAPSAIRCVDDDTALDRIVDHLNAHHPKPAANAAEWLERALNNPDERLVALDEARIEANIQRNRALRERDAAVARAEAAEARTAAAVSRADVERVVHRYIDGGFDELHASRVKSTTDAFMALLSGDDPAVHVVRESDIAAVEVELGSNWKANGTGIPVTWTARKVREMRDTGAAEWVELEAIARAIEAEAQAPDPVEEQATVEADRRYSGTPHHAFVEGALWAARHVLAEGDGRAEP